MANDLTLQTVSGPDESTFVVRAGASAAIGRAVGSDVCLLHERVSRRHAVIVQHGDLWYVIDQGSSGGTYLNNVKLDSGRPAPVSGGDLLRIGPWTFRVITVAGGEIPHTTTITFDDSQAPGARVERLGTGAIPAAGRRLRSLSALLNRLMSARDESALAKAAVEAALDGSGFARAAVVRPRADGADAEIIAEARSSRDDGSVLKLSRSLLAEAAKGRTVAMTGQNQQPPAGGQFGHSIADLGIHSAVCVPVMLGESPSAFLYLDARGVESAVREDAAGYCEAIAAAFALALANIKRIDLERRQHAMALQMVAARDVQRSILPPTENDFGFVSYAMEVRAGLFVAGDLFEALKLDDGRVAIALGDVSGHGPGSAMLMATTQAYLHAQLSRSADPAAAVAAANAYLADHSSEGQYATLWLGVFSPSGELTYVDAGHGYWIHARPDRDPIVHEPLDVPLGIDPGRKFSARTMTLAPGDRVVLFSDGIVEQRQGGNAAASADRFGTLRIARALTAGHMRPADDVSAVLRGVEAFAGTPTLDDDATVAAIHFLGT